MSDVFEHKEEHESYGMASFSRVSGGHGRLFGSEFQHQNYINLSISCGVRYRDLHREWYSDSQQLIQVAMSEAQYVELITHMNRGCGIPVTLQRVAGKMMEQPPVVETERQKSKTEFSATCAKVAAKLDGVIAQLTTAIDSGKLGKIEARDLLSKLGSVHQDIASNMPFAEDSFAEAMETTVTRAKTEIEAHMMYTVLRLGAEALQREFAATAPVLQIEGGK